MASAVAARLLQGAGTAWLRLRVTLKNMANHKQTIIQAIKRLVKKPEVASERGFKEAPDLEQGIVFAEHEPRLGPVLACDGPATPTPAVSTSGSLVKYVVAAITATAFAGLAVLATRYNERRRRAREVAAVPMVEEERRASEPVAARQPWVTACRRRITW